MNGEYSTDKIDNYGECDGEEGIVVIGSSGSVYLSVPIEEFNPRRPLSPTATKTRVLEEKYENPHICRKM